VFRKASTFETPTVDDDLILNGIDGTTGQYLVPPLSVEEAARIASGKPADTGLFGWFKSIVSVLKRPKLGLPLDVDPANPARAGWAIVLPAGASTEFKAAVQPLIDRRKSVVPPDRCKVLEYRPGETMKKWLARHTVAPGSVVPTKVPYYVTLVGGPEEIPFDFQYLLDVEYAVGRLAFDQLDGYRQYAESVKKYETAQTLANTKEVVYWGPRHAAADECGFAGEAADGRNPGDQRSTAGGGHRGAVRVSFAVLPRR
jgi:hypothetical protein